MNYNKSTTIRVKRTPFTEDLKNRNVVVKETSKTITFKIFVDANMVGLSEKNIKKNWNSFIY
jgi:hypothetical protein